jgi:transcriptional regulator with XRE-family HTH domain
MNIINSQIKERLIELEWSQGRLAKKIGVGRAAVSNWMQDLGTPQKELLPKIADAMGVSIDYLFGRNTDSLLSHIINTHQAKEPCRSEDIIAKVGKIIEFSQKAIIAHIDAKRPHLYAVPQGEQVMEKAPFYAGAKIEPYFRPRSSRRKVLAPVKRFLLPVAVGAGGMHENSLKDGEVKKEEHDVPDNPHSAIMVEGSSMEPTIMDGDSGGEYSGSAKDPRTCEVGNDHALCTAQ